MPDGCKYQYFEKTIFIHLFYKNFVIKIFATIWHTFYSFQFVSIEFTEKYVKYSIKRKSKILKLSKKFQNFEKNSKTKIFVPDGCKYQYFEKNIFVHLFYQNFVIKLFATIWYTFYSFQFGSIEFTGKYAKYSVKREPKILKL